jgi:hypothetical protein
MNTFQTISLTFGYGSKAKLDELKFDLCEDCLFEFVDSFKYAPETSE